MNSNMNVYFVLPFILYRIMMIGEDILADVFVAIWENWDTLKKIDNLNSYLFTSVKNRCLKFLNKQNHFEEYIEDLHIHLSIDSTTPESLLHSSEMTGIIENALNQLPQRCKLIFLMLKEENLKYKEVADILGISEKDSASSTNHC